jgi:hypothetical protein
MPIVNDLANDMDWTGQRWIFGSPPRDLQSVDNAVAVAAGRDLDHFHNVLIRPLPLERGSRERPY